ncbi:MAG: hypothetical protein JNL50_11170 [Phycisphaerae bacterium]|nr:hypothetical protein [Phycisphaerae bacterium]
MTSEGSSEKTNEKTSEEIANEFNRARALAGVLAERAVGFLRYEDDPASTRIEARRTDLPRAIVDLPEGRAIVNDTPPRFRLSRVSGTLRLESDDPALLYAFEQ